MNTSTLFISFYFWLMINIASPDISFHEGRAHDFGEVKVNTSTKHRFNFVNAGDSSLKVLNVTTTCGCTIAEYSKSVAPSDTGFVDVVYAAGSSAGVFKKYVMVMTNTSNQVDKLTIFGKVVQ